MYLIPALVVLAAPLLTCAKYVINHTSYSAGSVQLGVSSFSNAPPSFNLFLASSRSKQLMGNVSPPGSGVLDLALPEGTTPGGYHMQIADPTTQELFSTSDKFVVKPGDLAIASSLGLSTPSLSFSSTGSVIPVLTTALITDASGSTSQATLTVGPDGPITSTIPFTSASPSSAETTIASSVFAGSRATTAGPGATAGTV